MAAIERTAWATGPDPTVDWRRVAFLMHVSRGLDDLEETKLVPERKILYEDPELGFCILAHVYHGAKESAPHDHGPTWAIYGQAVGETVMSDWDKLAPASESEPGKVKLVREYTLSPGMAYVYNEGDLHSPRRAGSTKLIRIEGRNVDKIRRFPYEEA